MGKIEELRKKLGIKEPFYSIKEVLHSTTNLSNAPSDKQQSKELPPFIFV